MKYKKEWGGEYRDINYEIQNFSFSDGGSLDKWTFYLFIYLEQMPENVRERFWLKKGEPTDYGRTYYDYYMEPLISNIDWHCGCTFYEKVSGFDDEKRAVKIGCDYQHLWDEGRLYSEAGVERDARGAIDSLHDLVPGILKRCFYNGKYYPADQGEVNEHGTFLSIDGKKKQEDYNRKKSNANT